MPSIFNSIRSALASKPERISNAYMTGVIAVSCIVGGLIVCSIAPAPVALAGSIVIMILIGAATLHATKRTNVRGAPTELSPLLFLPYVNRGLTSLATRESAPVA